jgi:hypothetical protein
MPTTITPGQTVTVTSTFVNYDPDTGEETPVSPSNVDGYVFKYNASTAVYDLVGTFEPSPVNTTTFLYNWVPASNGKYIVEFEATLDSATVSDERLFYVGPITTASSIGEEKTYYFFGELDPIFLDPAEVLRYYPDGDLSEITEMAHWYSNDLMAILGVTSLEEEDIPPEGRMFILASILCELSRIYMFDGGLAGFGKADSFTLGDLTVRSGSSVNTANTFNGLRGSPTNWCELAVFLREYLRSSRVKIKAYVKSGSYLSPIKSRELRRAE